MMVYPSASMRSACSAVVMSAFLAADVRRFKSHFSCVRGDAVDNRGRGGTMGRIATIALVGFAVFALPPRAAIGSKIQKGTLIHLADGDVQGATNDRTRQFLGIPYAAPPVGT